MMLNSEDISTKEESSKSLKEKFYKVMMETRITLKPIETRTEVHLSKMKGKLNFRGIPLMETFQIMNLVS